MYNRENIRFIRNYNDFGRLLDSRKFMQNSTTQRKIILLYEDGCLAAYFVLIIDNKYGNICDCAGDKKAILCIIPQILAAYGLECIEGYILSHEKAALEYCNHYQIPFTSKRLNGTVAFIDFAGFMHKLKPYFCEVCDNVIVNNMEFQMEDNKICFKYGKQTCVLEDRQKQNDLIFGGGQELKQEDFSCTGGYEVFKAFFKAVFPLPFVNIHNLNFV